MQDGRLTRDYLGVDSNTGRRSFVIVFGGEELAVVGSRDIKCQRGECLFVPDGTFSARCSDLDGLEMEWDPGAIDEATPASATKLKLGIRTQAIARELGETLTRAKFGAEVVPALDRLLTAMNAEGMTFVPDAARAVEIATPAEQALMNAMDVALSRLHDNPMLVDLEGHAARRTLSRSVRRLHERYGLLGRGDGSWRSYRDLYRLVVAAIMLSHEHATPRDVAARVGYGSVEAFHHALRNACPAFTRGAAASHSSGVMKDAQLLRTGLATANVSDRSDGSYPRHLGANAVGSRIQESAIA